MDTSRIPYPRLRRASAPVRARMASLAVLALLVGASQAAAVPAASAATTQTCTQPGADYFSHQSVDGGDYTVSPDEWNSTQSVCYTTDGSADFDVVSTGLTTATDVPNTGAPGAYVNMSPLPAYSGLPQPINALGDTLTSWSTNLSAATGEYDVAYDIWYGDTESDCSDTTPPHEMMIWIDEGGGALPYPNPTSSSPAVTIGHKTYQVTDTGTSATRNIINYYLTTPTPSVYDLDLRLFIADAGTRGNDSYGNPYLPTNGYLCSLDAGFEIWNGSGEQTTSFSYQPAPTSTLPAGQITSAVPGMCLNAGGADPDQSATSQAVYAWDCGTAAASGAAGQDWTVHNSDTLQMFGLCLDEPSTASGASVTLDHCSYDDNEKWLLNGSTLVNLASGFCLTDPGSSRSNGAALDVTACGTSAAQQWREPYDGIPVGTAFANQTGGYCLTDTGSGTTELGTCASVPTSQENWQAEGNGTIVSSAGACLDAVQGETGDGDPGNLAQLNTCSGAATQQWLITPTGALMNPSTFLCLDDPSSSTTLGAIIDTYACNGSGAQIWASAATGL